MADSPAPRAPPRDRPPRAAGVEAHPVAVLVQAGQRSLAAAPAWDRPAPASHPDSRRTAARNFPCRVDPPARCRDCDSPARTRAAKLAYMAVAPWPGPPAKRNSGAAVARRLSAGTTATLKSMVAPPGRVRSSGTFSTPQRAGIDASRSGCSRRHSCKGSRAAAPRRSAGSGTRRAARRGRGGQHAQTGRPRCRAGHARRRSRPGISTHAACESPISADCRGFATRARPRLGRFAAQFVFTRRLCHDRDSRSRCDCQRCRRLAIHFLLSHAGFHPRHGACLRRGAKPVRARRHRADTHQFAHVRRRPSAHLPGHRHRGGVRQSGHGRALGCDAGSSRP